ncbi:MAG TPA: peptide chain release factor N(5)-glutamine methyltransferase, partial [Salinimicrobium sp.]|nr:peptide chain release factor N(5)-glutamine methyltransferase [Salinimicrobium sp.]
QLKIHFETNLKKEYPATEITSFFNLLASEYLKKNRLQMALYPEVVLEESEAEKFTSALHRLMQHEPIQYILEKTSFYGLDFTVNPGVLIPRPETEELVDWMVKDLQKVASQLSILDIGTGSGCIAVSLAKNLPRAKISAMDISETALETAKINAEWNHTSVKFIHLDILGIKELPQNFDIIVSNPPYVRELEKQEMQPNVLDYEPNSALYVKNGNPLVFYHKIADLAKQNLNKNGLVYLEINQYLAMETEKVFNEKGFKTELRKDIFGNYRMLKAVL